MQFINNHGEYFMHVIMRSDLSMVRVPMVLKRARKNSVHLFKEIHETTVLDVYCFENERCLCIKLEPHWDLLIKLFGNQSNTVLLQNGNPRDLFKSKISADMKLSTELLNRKYIISKQKLDEAGGDFTTMLPTLGGEAKNYIYRSGYLDMSLNQKWDLITTVLEQLDKPAYYLYSTGKGPKLTLFKPADYFFHTADVIEALNEFFSQYTRSKQFTGERKIVLRQLMRRKKKAGNTANKCRQRLDQLREGSSPREIADIIMAHMHLIPDGAETVELPDFKSGEAISIKLKPTLSPQKNAQYYYRKSKNQGREIKILKENLNKSLHELRSVNEHIDNINKCQDLKLLRKYARDHDLLTEAKPRETSILFKEFQFSGFVILVGKNASNNDLLTQKYTHKDDLWLHAKDVKGSHVVIRRIPGKAFPQPVIEKAAQLAAYYSKRKNDTLCPVIYTTKKYVRKPKGAAPGQVAVDRGKVILVTPKEKPIQR